MIDAGNAKGTPQVCVLAIAEEESWFCKNQQHTQTTFSGVPWRWHCWPAKKRVSDGQKRDSLPPYLCEQCKLDWSGFLIA